MQGCGPESLAPVWQRSTESNLHCAESPRSHLLELLDEAQRSGDDEHLAAVLALLNEPLKGRQGRDRSPGSATQTQQPDAYDQPHTIWRGVNLAAVDAAESWWRVLERHKLDSRVLAPWELLLHLVLIKQGWNKSVTLRFILQEADGDDCAAYVDSVIAQNMRRSDAPPSPRLMRSQSASGQSIGGQGDPAGRGAGTERRFAFGRQSTQKPTGTARADSTVVTRTQHSAAAAEELRGDEGGDWQCAACTFMNCVPGATVCEVCGAERAAIEAEGDRQVLVRL